MAVYPLDKRHNPDFAMPGKKPIGRMEIDWGDPFNGPNQLARGLKFFAVFNERYNRIQDLVSGALYDTDTGTWGIDAEGPYLDFTNTAIPIPELNLTAYTKIARVASDVSSGSQNVMSGNSSTASFLWANGGALWTLGHNYGAANMLTGSAVVAGQEITLAGTYNSVGTRASLYENGASVASTTSAPTFANTYLSLGDHVSNNQFAGKMRFAMHFDVEKSAAEVASLSRDPYQLLKPSILIRSFSVEEAGGVDGSTAVTLDDMVSAADGQVGEDVDGTIAETLADALSNTDGSVGAISGTVSETLDDAVSVSTGAVLVSGSVSETLDDATSAAAGSVIVSGSTAETLDDALSNADGSVGGAPTGTIAVLLDDVGSASSGLIIAFGSLSEALEDADSASTGIISVPGTSASTLDDATSTSAGLITVSGVVSESLDDVLSAAVGDARITGSVSETLDVVDSNSGGSVGGGTAGTVDVTLDDVASASAGEVGLVGTIIITLDDVLGASSGDVVVIGNSSTILDNILSVASGIVGTSASGTVALTLDDIVSTASGSLLVTGSASIALADSASNSTGFVGDAATGTIAQTLDDALSNSAGFVVQNATGTIILTLEDILSDSSGTAGVVTMLDTDPASATYNSYATRLEIDACIAALEPFIDTAAWVALTTDQKENVILKATDNANSFGYIGVTSNLIISPENMMWPRAGTLYTNGVVISNTEIPTFMKEYISERCVELLSFGPTQANSVNVTSNVKKQKVGGLSQEFFSPTEMATSSLSLRDFASYSSIKPYVSQASKSDSTVFLQRA